MGSCASSCAMLFVGSSVLGSPMPVKMLCSVSSSLQLRLGAFDMTAIRGPGAPLLMIPPLPGGTEYVDGSAVAAASIAYLLITICMSKRLNTIQSAFLNMINMTVQVLLTASSGLYIVVGGTLAYEEYLIGLSFTYMVMVTSILLSGD